MVERQNRVIETGCGSRYVTNFIKLRLRKMRANQNGIVSVFVQKRSFELVGLGACAMRHLKCLPRNAV